MIEENYQDPPPIDDYTIRKLLRDGAIPARLPSVGKREITYDLKFFWSRGSADVASWGHRMYFGNYFRNPALQASSITIGPGKPFKTDSIVVLLDAPPSSEITYAIKVYNEGKENGKGRYAPGCINSKPLIDLLYKSAKECGITLPLPKFVGDTVVITCSLIPMVKDGTENLKICILKIDNIEHRK